MKEYEDLIAEIDRKLQELDEDITMLDQLPPGTKFVEMGSNGIKKLYGICKAKDFRV